MEQVFLVCCQLSCICNMLCLEIGAERIVIQANWASYDACVENARCDLEMQVCVCVCVWEYVCVRVLKWQLQRLESKFGATQAERRGTSLSARAPARGVSKISATVIGVQCTHEQSSGAPGACYITKQINNFHTQSKRTHTDTHTHLDQSQVVNFGVKQKRRNYQCEQHAPSTAT